MQPAMSQQQHRQLCVSSVIAQRSNYLQVFFGVQEGHLEGKLHFHSVQREMGHRKITWAVVAVTFGSTGKPSLP
jgi:hypothetical protein